MKIYKNAVHTQSGIKQYEWGLHDNFGEEVDDSRVYRAYLVEGSEKYDGKFWVALNNPMYTNDVTEFDSYDAAKSYFLMKFG